LKRAVHRTLAYCLFEIPTGVLGDRIGARRVLTRIVLWWSAFTSLTGMVSNYGLLLLTRFAFGAERQPPNQPSRW
jgi:ACS family glucarate transporter-like MFS transporter